MAHVLLDTGICKLWYLRKTDVPYTLYNQSFYLSHICFCIQFQNDRYDEVRLRSFSCWFTPEVIYM